MAEKPEAGDSEDEVEDVYEVERIIDMRTEEVTKLASYCQAVLVSHLAERQLYLTTQCDNNEKVYKTGNRDAFI